MLALSATIGGHVALGDDIGHDADFNPTPDIITGFENATGGAGDDYLFGSSGANVLMGGNGMDILEGLGGRDVLTGGSDSIRSGSSTWQTAESPPRRAT